MTGPSIRSVRPAGDTGWLVTLEGPERPDLDLVRAVRAFREAVDAARVPGVVETHAAGRSVLVTYDPTAVKPDSVRRALAGITGRRGARPGKAGPAMRVPVCTCHACAPDARFVSEHTGLEWPEAVRAFCAVPYEVWFMGFQPGFPFLGPLPDGFDLPRLPTPRTRVAAGSVVVGGGLAGIFAAASPGGLRVLGRTPTVLFNPAGKRAAALAPGDRVVFDPLPAHPARLG